MKEIKLLIADDHPMVRHGLRSMVDGHRDIQVAAEVGTADDLMDALETTTVDVLLLDVSMPGPGIRAVLRQVQSRYPSVAVLVVSVHAEELLGVPAISAGASGYIKKDCTPVELTTAVRKVAQGGKYVSDSLAEHLADLVGRRSGQPPNLALSDRELHVLRRTASGKTVKQIAAELSLSPKTISTYRSRILNKLGLESQAEAVQYAIHNRLVD